MTSVRDAATVVLLRDGADGVEVWLLNRVARRTQNINAPETPNAGCWMLRQSDARARSRCVYVVRVRGYWSVLSLSLCPGL